MKDYVIVDFKKEANPKTPKFERLGFNDPIRHPNVNMHPTNYGIYKITEPTALLCYIPTILQDEIGVAQSIIDGFESNSYKKL